MLKIDPKAIGTEFSKIINEKILGTSSKLTVKLNKRFQIVDGEPGKVSYDLTTMQTDFGNFSAETELIFSFIAILKE